jgi:RNA polymerase sigma factor (sigma-70 family)
MTTAMPANAIHASAHVNSDADLVFASRNGDREAFGQIVRRYQGMISGLIYAACGDVHRSEDLAQETFLSAWKSLSGLREPAKLPAWLCQIARHRAQDQLRHKAAQQRAVGGFWARLTHAAAPPDEQAVRREEEAVLWRALSNLPQPYRETLVLYYRQGQSAEEVAAAMETTEAAVRQRLARGREMLRGQLTEMIERNLASTAPSESFASAVVAALPAMVPAAAKAAGVGGAVKGSLATGVISSITAWLGLAGGIMGGVAGSVAALRDDNTPAERRLTIGFLIKLWMSVIVIFPLVWMLFALKWIYHWSDANITTALAVTFAVYWIAVSTLVLRYLRRSCQLRSAARPVKNSWVTEMAIAAGPAIGGLSWMINLALKAGDWTGTGLAAAAIAAIAVMGFFAERRWPSRLMLVDTIGFAVTIVALGNWRLASWVAASRAVRPESIELRMWVVDACALMICAWVAMLTMLAVASRRQRQETGPQALTKLGSAEI